MAVTLGTLLLEVGLDLERYQADMEEAKARAAEFGAEMSRIYNNADVKPPSGFKDTQDQFGRSPLRPVVDMTELHALNAEFDRKKMHHISLQTHFERNHLTPRVDQSELTELNSTLDLIQDKLERDYKLNVTTVNTVGAYQQYKYQSEKGSGNPWGNRYGKKPFSDSYNYDKKQKRFRYVDGPMEGRYARTTDALNGRVLNLTNEELSELNQNLAQAGGKVGRPRKKAFYETEAPTEEFLARSFERAGQKQAKVISKAVKEGIIQGFKEKQEDNGGFGEIFSDISQGFAETFGSTIAQQIADGMIDEVEDSLQISLKNIGRSTAKGGLRIANTAAKGITGLAGIDANDSEMELKTLLRVTQEAGARLLPSLSAVEGWVGKTTRIIGDRVSEISFMLGDAVIDSFESDNLLSAAKTFFKSASNSFDLGDARRDLGEMIKEIKSIEFDLFPGLKSKDPSGMSLGGRAADAFLRARRKQGLRLRGETLVRDRAKEIYEEDSKFGSTSGVQSDTQEAFVVVGGATGEGGLGGQRIAEEIKDGLKEGQIVLSIDNPDSDFFSGEYSSPDDYAQAISKTFLRGYSKDAIEMAAQVYAMREQNPEIKIKLIGEGTGGYVAEEAYAILKQIGFEGVEYLGVGTPETIGRLDTSGENKVLSQDEPLGQYVAQNMDWAFDRNPRRQDVLGVQNGGIGGYLESKTPELVAFLGREGSLTEEEIKKLSSNAEKLKDFISQSSLTDQQRQSISEIAIEGAKKLRTQAILSTGAEAEKLSQLAESLENIYLKTVDAFEGSNDLEQTILFLNQIANEVEGNPGLNSAKKAAEALEILREDQEKVSTQLASSVGTARQKALKIQNEFNTLEKRLTDNSIAIPNPKNPQYASINTPEDIPSQPQEEKPKPRKNETAYDANEAAKIFSDRIADAFEIIADYFSITIKESFADASKSFATEVSEALQKTFDNIAGDIDDIIRKAIGNKGKGNNGPGDSSSDEPGSGGGGKPPKPSGGGQGGPSPELDDLRQALNKAVMASLKPSLNPGVSGKLALPERSETQRILDDSRQMMTDYRAILENGDPSGEIPEALLTRIQSEILKQQQVITDAIKNLPAKDRMTSEGGTLAGEKGRLTQFLKKIEKSGSTPSQETLGQVLKAIKDEYVALARIIKDENADDSVKQQAAIAVQSTAAATKEALDELKKSLGGELPIFLKKAIASTKGQVTRATNIASEVDTEGVELSPQYKSLIDKGIGKQTEKVQGSAKFSRLINEIASAGKEEAAKVSQNIVMGLATALSEDGEVTNRSILLALAIIKAFKDTFEIQSPSKVMMRLGRQLSKGLSEGISEGDSEISDSIADMSELLEVEYSPEINPKALLLYREILEDLIAESGRLPDKIPGIKRSKFDSPTLNVSAGYTPTDMHSPIMLKQGIKPNDIWLASDVADTASKADPSDASHGKAISGVVDMMSHESRHAAQHDWGGLTAADLTQGMQPGITLTDGGGFYTDALREKYEKKEQEIGSNATRIETVHQLEADAYNYGRTAGSVRLDEYLTRYQDELNKALDKVSEDQIQKYQESLKSLSKYIEENGLTGKYAKLAKEVVQQQQTTLREKGFTEKTPTNLLATSVADKLDEGAKEDSPDLSLLGEEAAKSLLLGLKEQLKSVSEAGMSLGVELEEAIRTQLEMHSPSEVMKRLGRFAAEGFSNGVETIKSILPIKADGIVDVDQEIAKHDQRQENKFLALEMGINPDDYDMLSDSLEEAQKAQERIEQNLRKTDAVFGEFFEESESKAQSFLNTLKSFGGDALVSFIGVGVLKAGVGLFQNIVDEAITLAVELEGVKTTMRFVEGSITGASEQMARISKLSTQLGVSEGAAIEGYAQLASATRGTTLEGESTQQISDAIQQAGAVSQIDDEQLKQANTAITQIAGKGKLSAEELRQQLSEVGGVFAGSFQIAARSLGVTTAELDKMLQRGEILSEDFLPKFAQQLSAETASGVAGAAKTAQASINRFNNATINLKATLGEQLLPARQIGLELLANSMVRLQELMPFLVKGFTALALFMGGRFLGAASKAATVLSPLIEQFKSFIGLEGASFGNFNIDSGKNQTFGDRVFDNVTSAFTPAKAQEKEFGDVSLDELERVNESIRDQVKSMISESLEKIKNLPKALSKSFSGMGDRFKQMSNSAGEAFSNISSTAMTSLKNLPKNVNIAVGKSIASFKAMGRAAVVNMLNIGNNALIMGKKIIKAIAPMLLFMGVIETIGIMRKSFGDLSGEIGGFAEQSERSFNTYREAVAKAKGETTDFKVAKSDATMFDDSIIGQTLGKGGSKKLEQGFNLAANVSTAPIRGVMALAGRPTDGVRSFAEREVEAKQMATNEFLDRNNQNISEVYGPDIANAVNELQTLDSQIADLQAQKRNTEDFSAKEQIGKELDALQSQRATASAQTGGMTATLAQDIELLEALKKSQMEDPTIDPDVIARTQGHIDATKKAMDRLINSTQAATSEATRLANEFALIQARGEDAQRAIAQTNAKRQLGIAEARAGGASQGQLQQMGAEMAIANATDQRNQLAKQLAENLEITQDDNAIKEAFSTVSWLNEDMGASEILQMIENNVGGGEATEEITRLREYAQATINAEGQQGEIINLDAEVFNAQADLREAVREGARSLRDFFNQAKDNADRMALEAEAAQIQIDTSSQQNKLKEAVTGFQNSFIDGTVDSLIGLLDTLNQGSLEDISAQQAILDVQTQMRDQETQAMDLQRSLPSSMLNGDIPADESIAPYLPDGSSTAPNQTANQLADGRTSLSFGMGGYRENEQGGLDRVGAAEYGREDPFGGLGAFEIILPEGMTQADLIESLGGDPSGYANDAIAEGMALAEQAGQQQIEMARERQRIAEETAQIEASMQVEGILNQFREARRTIEDTGRGFEESLRGIERGLGEQSSIRDFRNNLADIQTGFEETMRNMEQFETQLVNTISTAQEEILWINNLVASGEMSQAMADQLLPGIQETIGVAQAQLQNARSMMAENERLVEQQKQQALTDMERGMEDEIISELQAGPNGQSTEVRTRVRDRDLERQNANFASQIQNLEEMRSSGEITEEQFIEMKAKAEELNGIKLDGIEREFKNVGEASSELKEFTYDVVGKMREFETRMNQELSKAASFRGDEMTSGLRDAKAQIMELGDSYKQELDALREAAENEELAWADFKRLKDELEELNAVSLDNLREELTSIDPGQIVSALNDLQNTDFNATEERKKLDNLKANIQEASGVLTPEQQRELNQAINIASQISGDSSGSALRQIKASTTLTGENQYLNEVLNSIGRSDVTGLMGLMQQNEQAKAIDNVFNEEMASGSSNMAEANKGIEERLDRLITATERQSSSMDRLASSPRSFTLNQSNGGGMTDMFGYMAKWREESSRIQSNIGKI